MSLRVPPTNTYQSVGVPWRSKLLHVVGALQNPMLPLGPSLGAFCSETFANTRILAAGLEGLESSEQQ